MGRQFQASEEGGLFSLELSSHGGSAFLLGKESVLLDSTGSAEVDGAKLSSFCAPATVFEHKLLEAVKRFKPASLMTSELDHEVLAKLLTSKGYTVSVHAPVPQCTCKPNSRRCLEVLSHTYLVCTGTVDYQSETEIIVEPKLREQFEIAHQTESYQRLLLDVPAEFVGSRERLKLVVEAVSAAMAQAFKAQDLPLPPWRRTAATLSKWGLEVGPAGRSPSHSPEAKPGWQPAVIAASRNLKSNGPQRFGFPDNQEAEAAALGLMSNLQRTSAERACNRQAAAAQHRTVKPPISLLARGLADMELVQKAKRPLEGGKAQPKIKRIPSWDFSGLAPINTVRRSGRVK